ncbi:hypothetical protein [Photorhabdus heterorhabditis]|uniref:Uncharacterized protein n=1 Tax=Photorhabdus heterorhabditis TaxID=880156 RepID=A0A5B0X675_9GAMM|nr:hypothetical protein [Photorhabdus heterorhabditis]KAA1194860.1 hypothetical protein F0L16_04070 [Photorhabdus heterorhabditis]MBS9442295.1 hypothetical protein [Photorhabdus heterorhabditis]
MNTGLDITFNGSYASKLRVIVSLLRVISILIFNEKATLTIEGTLVKHNEYTSVNSFENPDI